MKLVVHEKVKERLSRGIIYINGKYAEWSNVCDAPATYLCDLDEFQEYIKEQYGLQGLRELDERLERARRTGTSYHNRTLDDVISFNRAGPNEECLSKDELIKEMTYNEGDT